MVDRIAMNWNATAQGVQAMKAAAAQLRQQSDEIISAYTQMAAVHQGQASEAGMLHVQKLRQARTNLDATLTHLGIAVEQHSTDTNSLDIQQAKLIGGVS